MGEQEISERLANTRRGDTLIVREEARKVSDISDYTLGDFDWRNIATKKGKKEEILEIFPGKKEVRIWLPVRLKEHLTPQMEKINYSGEIFTRKEFGTAEVVNQTEEGPEEYEVDYSVLHALSGHRLSVEDDGEEITVYYSDEVIILTDIQFG